MELKNVVEERAELIALIQGPEFEGEYRDWDGDKRTKWDEANAKIDELTEEKETIEGEQAVAERKVQLQELEARKSFARKTEFGEFKADKYRTAITKEHRALAFQGWLFQQTRHGDAITKEHEQAFHLFKSDFKSDLILRLGTGHQRSFQCWSTKRGSGRDMSYFNDHIDQYLHEYRGPMDTGTPGAGAEWVPAEDFRAELIRFMIAFGPIRGVCRTITTARGEPMRMPTGDNTARVAAVKAEKTASSFEDPVTGDRTWTAHKYNTGVKWSYEMAQDSPLNVQSILAEYLGEGMGRGQSEDMTNGDGTNKIRGITLDASDSGATWSLSGTGPDNADSLIDAQTSLDPAYEMAGTVGWMFNKTILGEIRKIKDTQGRYIWQPGLRLGEPDLLLGDTYVVNQNMPGPVATNRAILYGDFSSYIIRDAGAMRLRVLNELYAETDEFGMIAWYRTDGKLKRVDDQGSITADPSMKYVGVVA